jgi:hypothetical protein
MPLTCAIQKTVVALLVLTVMFCAAIRDVAAQVVRLPVTVDYSLLQTLIIRKAFTEADQSVILLNKGNRCLFLSLAKPTVSEAEGLVRFETQVSVHAGTPVADQCLVPLEWQGFLVLYQRPVIDGDTWKLSFTPARSTLLTSARQPARIAAVLWDLIKSRVFTYLESIKIDLAPPVGDIKNSLLPMFPPKVQEQTKAMLTTLRAGETRVTPRAVVVDLLVDVKEVYRPGETPQTEVLTGRELDDMVGVWEQWDALLSYLVSTLSRNMLTEDEQQTLRDVLLETRYAFVEGLSSRNLTHDFVREQFVRAWRRLSPIFRNHLGQNPAEQSLGYLAFFSAADALSVLDGLGPTFGVEVSRDGLIRMARMLTADPSVLTYGPAVNPDLQRLFQLMPVLQTDTREAPENRGEHPDAGEDRSGAGKDPAGQDAPKMQPDQGNSGENRSQAAPAAPSNQKPADQEGDIDHVFANPEKAPAPDTPVDQDGTKSRDSRSPAGRIEKGQPSSPPGQPDSSVLPSKEGTPEQHLQERESRATTPEDGQGEGLMPASQRLLALIRDFFCSQALAADLSKYDIQRWRVSQGGEEQYFKNVVGVLDRATQSLFSKGELPSSMQEMYHALMFAMAWQESCFRQFVEKDRQLTYLLSYNNTSVGLMQVNERVWRGIYDQERLRWDIEYNAVAGGEIAGLYLQKYALRDKGVAKKLDDATLARLVYAMYNGGPAQYRDFLERRKTGKMWSYDNLFLEKYSEVMAGKGDKAPQCLSGD